jgi:hypothetical protein
MHCRALYQELFAPSRSRTLKHVLFDIHTSGASIVFEGHYRFNQPSISTYDAFFVLPEDFIWTKDADSCQQDIASLLRIYL